MIETYFIKPETCDRIRTSPLGDTIERYVTWMHEQGYAARNVHRRVPTLVNFGMHARDRGARELADFPEHIDSFLEEWFRDRERNDRDEKARQMMVRNLRGPIEQMFRLILPEFAGSKRAAKPFPFLNDAPGFSEYLRQERGISQNTFPN
jgi:hypothetical protein